jgi:hypothetical protein
MSPGDLVLDVDAMHTALTGMPSHDHYANVLPFVYEARDAVRAKLERDGFDGRLWVISTAATIKQRQVWRQLCRREVHVEADIEACKSRARLERPVEWLEFIKQWFAEFEHG